MEELKEDGDPVVMTHWDVFDLMPQCVSDRKGLAISLLLCWSDISSKEEMKCIP